MVSLFNGGGGSVFNGIYHGEGITNHPNVLGNSVLIQKGVTTGDSHHSMGGYASGSSGDQSIGLDISHTFQLPFGKGLVMLQNLGVQIIDRPGFQQRTETYDSDTTKSYIMLI